MRWVGSGKKESQQHQKFASGRATKPRETMGLTMEKKGGNTSNGACGCLQDLFSFFWAVGRQNIDGSCLGVTRGSMAMGESEGKLAYCPCMQRRGGSGSQGGAKRVDLAMRRVGNGVAGRGGAQIEWNTKLARLGDGCGWFERGPGDFSDARALHRTCLGDGEW